MAQPSDSSTANLPALSPAAVAHGWRRLAHSAAGTPWLHEEVARRLADKLEVIRLQPRTWIDWWGHAGGGTAGLRSRYPDALGIVVEPTAALLERHRPPALRRLRAWLTREGGIEHRLEADPIEPECADMIWANLVVQAVPDPAALFARWHALLRIDGFLMFSTLGPDTLQPWRGLAQRAAQPPLTLDFIDMHDLGDLLVQAGFADPVMDMEQVSLTWADARALLSDLRACGVNAHPARFAGLRTPRWREALVRHLERELRGADARLRLRFEFIYGHAIKPAPRVRVAEQTSVSLDQMRRMIRGGSKGHPDNHD